MALRLFLPYVLIQYTSKNASQRFSSYGAKCHWDRNFAFSSSRLSSHGTRPIPFWVHSKHQRFATNPTHYHSLTPSPSRPTLFQPLTPTSNSISSSPHHSTLIPVTIHELICLLRSLIRSRKLWNNMRKDKLADQMAFMFKVKKVKMIGETPFKHPYCIQRKNKFKKFDPKNVSQCSSTVLSLANAC